MKSSSELIPRGSENLVCSFMTISTGVAIPGLLRVSPQYPFYFQFFGLYGLSGRISSMIGPSVIQAIINRTRQLFLAETYSCFQCWYWDRKRLEWVSVSLWACSPCHTDNRFWSRYGERESWCCTLSQMNSDLHMPLQEFLQTVGGVKENWSMSVSWISWTISFYNKFVLPQISQSVLYSICPIVRIQTLIYDVIVADTINLSRSRPCRDRLNVHHVLRLAFNTSEHWPTSTNIVLCQRDRNSSYFSPQFCQWSSYIVRERLLLDASQTCASRPLQDLYSQDISSFQWQRWRKNSVGDRWYCLWCDRWSQFLRARYATWAQCLCQSKSRCPCRWHVRKLRRKGC